MNAKQIQAVANLRAVLTNPEGKACIHGSPADLAIIDDALQELGANEPKVAISPLAPSGELFNALMAHYGNPARATPTDSISKTMHDACRHAGLFEGPPPSRIISG